MIRARPANLRRRHWRIFHIDFRNIFRQLNNAKARLFGFRNLKRLADDLRHVFSGKNCLRPLADWLAHPDRIHDLVALFVKPLRRALSDYRNNGRPIHIGIRNPC